MAMLIEDEDGRFHLCAENATSGSIQDAGHLPHDLEAVGLRYRDKSSDFGD
jgi:hypothetical protein